MMDPNEAPTMRSRARLGAVLREKWRLDELLGVGGMATVYAATHCNNGKRVAIKVLHQELSVVPEMRNRFLREGYVANKVSHPSIVSVLDDDIAEDGSVFLVMELLDGMTVEALRERSGNFLTVDQVAQIGDQLLDVLAAAHEAGIIHRDIKPENLFLTRDGELKVLDFGIARLRELQSATITITGAPTMGTPAFMAPEQARGRSEQVSPRTDIWAVGATLFTLASGRLVHDADTVNELLLAAMTRAAPPILTVLPLFPSAIAKVIDRALLYEQSARWDDARAMQTALRSAAASIGLALQERMVLPAFPPRPPLGLAPTPPGGNLVAPTEDDVVGNATPSPSASGRKNAAGRGNPRSGSKATPILATAPAVTMGDGMHLLLSGRRALQPKWILAIAGLLIVPCAVGLWFSLRSEPTTTRMHADAPTASATASASPAPEPPAGTVTVEPAQPVAPSATPAPPPVEQSATPTAPSAPLPSSKPVAQPPPKKPPTPPGPPNTPDPDTKRKPDQNILDKQY